MRTITTTLATLTVAAAIAVGLIAPATSQAWVSLYYKGYARVTPASGNTWAYAYRRNLFTGAWKQTYRDSNERVWVEPFGGGWVWTWKLTSLWLAKRQSNLTPSA